MSALPPLGFFFGGAPGTPELLVIMVAVLLLFGAKRLPEIARNLGKSMEMFRRAARDVTDEIMHGNVEDKKPDALAALPDAHPDTVHTDDELAEPESEFSREPPADAPPQAPCPEDAPDDGAD